MFVSLALLALLAPSPSSAAQDDPAVRITLNEAGRYQRGDYAKVKVRVENDGYLLVLHADPDGRVRVLYPIDPDDDTWVRGRRNYQLRDRGGDDRLFMVEDQDGRGVVLAAVSRDPFRFEEFTLNRHWDFDALNVRDARGDEEAVLTGIASRMAQGGYDYDLATYIVNDYVDVAYAPVSYVSPVYYYDSYCDGWYYSYRCDPYYYNRYRGSSISIHIGNYYDPYGHGYGYYYPYYYGYRPAAYYPYYYPRYPRYYGYRPGDYFGTYRPRYTTPSQFKQDDRTWGGLAYRDRLGTSTRSVNTVYDPSAPTRRAVTSGDAGRSPLINTQVDDRNGSIEASPRRASTPVPSSRPDQPQERRRVDGRQPEGNQLDSREAEPARAAPRRVEQSTVERIRSRESAPSRRVESQRPEPTIERAAPQRAEPRRVEPSRVEPSRAGPSRVEPSRAEPSRDEPSRAEPRRATSSPPQASASRAEPRRVEPSRAEPSRAEPVRAQPSRVSEAPRQAPASRASSGRSAPSPSRAAAPSRSSGGSSPAPARSSGGGGGRRGPR